MARYDGLRVYPSRGRFGSVACPSSSLPSATSRPPDSFVRPALRSIGCGVFLDYVHTSIRTSKSAQCQYSSLFRSHVSRTEFRRPYKYTLRDFFSASDSPSEHTRLSSRFPAAERFELYAHGILCHSFGTFDVRSFQALPHFSHSTLGTAHSVDSSAYHTRDSHGETASSLPAFFPMYF